MALNPCGQSSYFCRLINHQRFQRMQQLGLTACCARLGAQGSTPRLQAVPKAGTTASADSLHHHKVQRLNSIGDIATQYQASSYASLKA